METTQTTEGKEADTARLTHDVAELLDKAVADGVVEDILTCDDVLPLFSNAADVQWLKNQLEFDISQHQYNIWGK